MFLFVGLSNKKHYIYLYSILFCACANSLKLGSASCCTHS